MQKLLSVLFVLAFVACTPKFTGSLVVDGKQVTLQGCRSGQASKFVGVDLETRESGVIRLNYDLNGQARVFMFPTEAPGGVEVGLCGAMTIEQQTSRINHIYNQRGSAKLQCSGAGHSVSGELTFENCH